MPPKGSRGPGTRAEGSGGGQDSKDLSYFQEIFTEARKQPQNFKSSIKWKEVERLVNDGTDDTTKLLARLCYSRVQYEALCKLDRNDVEARRILEDVTGRLDPLLRPVPRSVTACNLHTAVLLKARDIGIRRPEQVHEEISDLYKQCEAHAEQLADPADEVIVTVSPSKFEKAPDAPTKDGRVRQCLDWLKKEVAKAKEAIKAVNPTAGMLHEQLAAMTKGQQQGADKSAGEQAPVADAASRAERANQLKDLEQYLATREALEEELNNMLPKLKSKLSDEAGPAGVAKLCKLFDADLKDFERDIRKEVEAYMEAGGLTTPELKSVYYRMTDATIARMREAMEARAKDPRAPARMLRWQQMDLAKVLSRPAVANALELMMEKKDEGGSKEGGGGGGKSGKKGASGKGGSGKGGQKAAAAGSAAGAAADASSGIGSLDELLEWFRRTLEENGEAYKSKILDSASMANVPRVEYANYKQLESPELVKVLHLHLGDADGAAAADANGHNIADSFFSELMHRSVRVLEPLVVSADGASEAPDAYGADNTELATRFRFSAGMRGVEALYRHSILECVAEQYSICKCRGDGQRGV
ncbi:hypothetical protein GPECTOR_2g1540 [Gonium pectorale]|uniref:Uncharacterized protein n=1 Tax=Gonium pectorale TaxID=33097 RepID=A0A150H2D5_GONPE|nr:hypothetical protein GPECTOR_2g1540 [Gonium pectorale]|eukprot:KXZ55988.1 hypothetical protein GPECTOR_2g1540 [Gonium pectorale]